MSECNHDGTSTSAAKRKADRAVTYPRKRALIACEICRRRKTKCDNVRPTCGGCRDLEIECVYADLTSKHGTYDMASLEILDRINYVASLLENHRDKQPKYTCIISNPPPVQERTPQELNLARTNQGLDPYLSPGSQPWSEGYHGDTSTSQDEAEILLESLEIAGRTPQVSEDILNWPIFGQNFDRSDIESLIFSPQNHEHRRSESPSFSIVNDEVRSLKPGKRVCEEDILPLIDRFLINVHIKNPVLDADDLIDSARKISENGFSWDATSCLVLIVCALANISSTFSPECVTPQLVNEGNMKNSIGDTPDYATAENYYIAAQKRVGLLENSIPTTQCYFLTGVYEMYSLRPMRAWVSFNRACQTLQIYLRGQKQKQEAGVERRLYWSCLKSECEIRMEINLPSSGLAKANYPDVFPTPPTANSPDSREAVTSTTDKRKDGFSTGSTRFFEPDIEQIWKYYLSEIAVRQIGNRLMNSFYKTDESAWLCMPLDRMIRVAEELELQLTQWFDNLPTTLLTTTSSSSVHETHNKNITNELQYMLHARLNDFRERIYRPFLYLAIHSPAEDPTQQRLTIYVRRCVDACLACLMRGTPRHRHHGTWYENRGMFLKSVLLVAAVKSGNIYVPDLWRQGVELCTAGFKFWEQEAPDLREARNVLEGLLMGLECANSLPEPSKLYT